MKKLLSIVFVLVLAIGVLGACGDTSTASGSADDGKTKETATKDSGDKKPEKKKEKKDETKKIGQPLKVGDVVFTINSVKTAQSVGGEFGTKAQGKYIILNVTVKNEGKEAVMTDSSFFKLVNGDTKYDADGAASMMANDDAQFLAQNVNPGVSNKGNVAFDVPKDLKPEDLVVQVQTGFFGTETGKIKLQK